MRCIKCKKEISDSFVYCPWCGKKQIKEERKALKRANGTGTVYKLSGRRRHPWKAEFVSYDGEFSKTRFVVGYFERKTDALDALGKLSKEAIALKSDATIEDVYNEWSVLHYPKLSKNGMQGYKTAWKYLYKLHDIKMSEVRTQHFQDCINDVVSLNYSRSQCEKVKQLCSQLCKKAMQDDIINKNYAEFLFLPKEDKKEKEIFSQNEIRILFQHDNDDNVKIILMMIYTGFRIGEMLGLETNNVHLEKGYMVGGSKTEAGRNRIVPISEKILPYVQHFYNPNNQYLIVNQAGNKYDIKNFRSRQFYPTLDRLGIRRLTPHATRHTFASLMSNARVQPEVLQKIIGHADYSTTANIYIHEDLERLKKAVNLI